MRRWLVPTALLWMACGHNPTTPAPLPTPTPRPLSRYPIAGVVYYDENANGVLDDGERVRMPGVGVVIGDRMGVSGGDGGFVLTDAAEGTPTATAESASLPPFFVGESVAGVPVPPPTGFLLAFPVALPIGSNRPDVYMAFGDSITVGDGSRGGRGYRSELAALLRDYWGVAEVANQGVTGTQTSQGAERIGASLTQVRPAYTLIHYGTNDWNSTACRYVPSCNTVSNLQSMIGAARSVNSVPVVATIIPANPVYVDRGAWERNVWIAGINDRIRPMVREQGAILADLHAAFMAEAGDNLESLFSDHIHPNDRGYQVMAQGFFRAITTPRGAAK